MEADVAARPFVGHERRQRGQFAAGLIRGDRTILAQATQNIGKPLLRTAGMAVGIEIVRPLGQPGKQSAFLERELLGRLAEIAARGQLDAPGAAAEIDGIEIELEDFLLAQRVLDPRRHDHLANFALVGEVFADQQVLHDLLGDGRAALRAPGAGEVADEGADQAALVDPLVLIEALVLGRDERLLHVLRNVGEHHPDAALILLEHLGETLALAVEHDARARQLEALELGVIGQVGGRLVVEIDHVAEIDRRRRPSRSCKTAGRPMCRSAKLMPRNALLSPTTACGSSKRGRDEVLEIDVLDVEGLAHMGAASAQQLRDLLLIAGAIELGFHRLGRGRHLAERQRRGKDFDEERFHRTLRKLEPKASTAPLKSSLQNGFLGCVVPSARKFPESRPNRQEADQIIDRRKPSR